MHGLDSVMNGVFVRELRSGAGGVGACCVVCSGQLPGISSRGTCCIGALCIETASKAQRWDVQRLLRKKGSTWCHLFLWTTFAARPDFVSQPCHLFTSIDFATLVNSVILLASLRYCPTITKSLSGSSIV